MVTVGRVVAAVAALALAAAISPAHAQTLRGQIVEEGTSRPIEAAMISLIDEAGKRVGSAWSDASGRFFLRAPGPGAYTLHVERIGYETAASPVLELAAGQTLDYRMEVPTHPITLAEITAVGDDRRCVVRPGEASAETARVWEEARKALDATARSETERMLRFEGARYRRRLDPDRRRVLEETLRPVSGYYQQPFVSPPAEELATEGYIRAVEGGRYFDFFAPSAEVLLSDSFVEHHCMRLVAGRGET
ncbi:MAG: carboxypeptidase-like regulatory domain-containing protein, partial [Gemmatimonadota bacterium]